MKKIMILSIGLLVFTSCGQKDSSGTKTQILKLAHNHSNGYPVDIAYKKFAELVNQKSSGRYTIEVYPDAQLGNSVQVVELAQSGVVQFAHINSAALESFDEIYAVFNLPYIFKDYEHFRKVMDSQYVRDVFATTIPKGFMPFIYLEGGARSFYTKNKAINSPQDLKGLKIRVQESPTSIEMIKLLGGTPVVLSFGEVYTSLQQGVIDGAENNAPSLVQTGHAEVAKQFSLNEHLRLADFLVVSSLFWNQLSEEDKTLFSNAAQETIEFFADVWKKSEQEAFDRAEKEFKVTITKVDTEPFKKLVLPMHEAFAKKNPQYKKLIDHIRSLESKE
ncbi:MAG: TRAP transporter substrate-binding protein [Brevinema sp.]